ncbi:MAG: hypothetical protein KC643_31960 [Nitrospira sp.]|nr:hypothetical protein [Nitrospira sp.]MDR4483932.1 mercuric transporter MerT family protein [Nitrospirales bacterium]
MSNNTKSEGVNLTEESAFQEGEGVKRVTEPASVASVGGIIAAFFASLCCIGPVVFSALGVGVGATGLLASTAGFLKALVPYRPLFILVAVVAIGTGFYFMYRKPKAGCALDSNCTSSPGRGKSMVFLWVATALTLFFVLSPYWLGIFK